jgi:Spy/CpxP family protein refolding chaperone
VEGIEEMNTKRNVVAMMLALGMLAVSPVATAKGGSCGAKSGACKGKGKGCSCAGKHGKKLEAKLRKLGLAEDAVKQALEAKAQWQTAKKATHEQIREKRAAMRAELAGAADEAKLTALAEEVSKLQGEILKGKVAFKAKVAKLLGAEQRATFFAKKAGKKGKKGCSCGH